MTQQSVHTVLAGSAAASGVPCTEKDPELWFPKRDLYREADDQERAEKLCAGCPLAAQCLDYALSAREEHGIWGGMTAKDRLDLLNRRQGGSITGRLLRPGAAA